MKSKSNYRTEKPVLTLTPELIAGPWTRFFDMNSGGGAQEPWDVIYIQGGLAEAIERFEQRFGHHPDDIACPCCGQNYSVGESDDLDKASRYCRYEIPLIDYINRPDILVIPSKNWWRTVSR